MLPTLFVALALSATTALAGSSSMPPLPAEVLADLAKRDPSEYQTFQLRDGLEKRGPPNGLTGVKTRCTTSHCFDFTFDDGPYIYSKNITDTALANGVKVTFFVNVLNWSCAYDEPFASDLKYAYDNGMQICSHTATHPHLNTLSYAEIDKEIEIVETMLHKTIGAVPACIRPPYGEANKDVVNYLNQKHGLVVINWTDDAGDAEGDPVSHSEAVYEKIKAPKHAIVLNHEPYANTAHKLFPKAIKIAQKNGYTTSDMDTVPASLKFNGYKSVTTAGKRDSTWNCKAAQKLLCSYDPKSGYC